MTRRIPAPLRPLVGAAVLAGGVRAIDGLLRLAQGRRSAAPTDRAGTAANGLATTLVRALALGAVLLASQRIGRGPGTR